MSLTATEVLNFFDRARRNGHTEIKSTCDCCGRPGCGVYACAYRESQLLRNRPDPGNLCPICASKNETIIGRIIAESKLAQNERDSHPQYRRRQQQSRH